jgi:hypothetical protein
MTTVIGSVSWYNSCPSGNNGGSCQNCGTYTFHGAYPNVAGRTNKSCSSIPQLKCYPCSSGTCKVKVKNLCNGASASNVEIRDVLPANLNCGIGVNCGSCSGTQCHPVMDLNWFVFAGIADLATGRIKGELSW